MLVVGLAICLFPAVCRADLYTADAASLEWKVDSCEEIYLATVVEDPTLRFGLRFSPLQTLKAGRPLESFPHHTVFRCRLGRYLDPEYAISAIGTQWLVFVRGQGETARISNAIFLTHPRADWRVAAITADGKGDQRVLRSRREIIRRVKARVAQNKTLPTDCDPDLTDQLIEPDWGVHAPIARWLGGKVLRVNINLWTKDNGHGSDFDTWVNDLLVPLDIPQGLAKAERTRQMVGELETIGMSEAAVAAFKRAAPEDNRSRLLGTWKSELADRVVTVTLGPRHTMLYLVEPKPGNNLSPLPATGGQGFGGGFWQTYGNNLRLESTHYVQDRWRRPKQWIAASTWSLRGDVVAVNDATFGLSNGATFVRQSGPLRVYDHPHEHPWYVVSEGWGQVRGNADFQVGIAGPGNRPARPCEDLVLMRDARRDPKPPGPRMPILPATVRVILGDQGFDPRIAVLRSGDTLEIHSQGARPAIDHNLNISWLRNPRRGFRERLDPPLIFRREIQHAEPAVLSIRCNIHDDEKGHLIVTDHPSVSVSSKAGLASLDYWPLGKRTIRLLHPDYDLRDASIWLNGTKIENDQGRIQVELHPQKYELKIVLGRKHPQ